MKLYKLTDENHQTRGNTQWGEGVTHTAPGTGPLCSPGWIHAYSDPRIALIINSHHADFYNPVLWEAEGSEPILIEPLKLGVASLTTIKVLKLPVITGVNYIAFAILCSLEVYKETNYTNWANNWLNGIDRTNAAANAAANDAAYAAYAAAYAAANAAAYAAAYAAANAAYAAYTAANAAVYTAAYAAAYAADIDFIALIDKAMAYV